MKVIFKPNHPIRQLKSFKYAFQGLFNAFMSEPNFRIQLFIVALSIILGKILQITVMEWVHLSVVLGFLLIMELVNTVIEEIMDQLFKEKREGVKVIKDLSAAVVLITAIVVLINLIVIFGPKIINVL